MLAATSDPQFDLSLRFLSLVVSGAIVAALLWYLVLILQPLADKFGIDEVGPPAWAAMPEVVSALPPVASVDATARGAAPAATVFRCDVDGSVTYTDRPCDRGGVRVLRLPRR